MFKLCTGCKIEKHADEFSPRKDGVLGRHSRCRECRRSDRPKYIDNRRNRYSTDENYRRSNLKAQKKYRDANRDRINERLRAKRRLLKLAVFEKYGNRCDCCSETQFEFLAIDHINGQGNQERKNLSVNKLYRTLSKTERQDKYRLLCHNCNMSLGFFGYCPHNVN